MSYEWNLRAACGYAELGMARESIAELDAIECRFQRRPEVLKISRELCRVAPDCGAGFLHAGFCLHELGKTKQAKDLLLKGPVALLKEPIYYYNMGCYDALLGNVDQARENLETSFKMDSTFRELAKVDPDLETLQTVL